MKIREFSGKIFGYCLAALLFVACASEYDRLTERYDLISRQILTLESELKATVTMEQSTTEYLKVRQIYHDKLEKLLEARSQNDSDGVAVGRDVDADTLPEDMPKLLKNNYDQISDKIHELKNIRNEVVKRQTAMETSPDKP